MPQLDQKTVLFEQTAIPRAVAQLAIPTIFSCDGHLQSG